MTRYALRIDANQTAIVSALEAAGATVEVIGKPVDLLVGINGKWMMVEVKDGKKVKSAQKLTVAQVKFFDKWAGYPLALVDSAECALRMLKVLAAE